MAEGDLDGGLLKKPGIPHARTAEGVYKPPSRYEGVGPDDLRGLQNVKDLRDAKERVSDGTSSVADRARVQSALASERARERERIERESQINQARYAREQASSTAPEPQGLKARVLSFLGRK